MLALQNIGLDNIASALMNSSPTFVLLGLADHVRRDGAASRVLARDPQGGATRGRLKLSDAMQGTFIGVLMSSTLPARLGEPSRALVVARRTGRPRENLPVVLGTLVSQTLLNIVALAVLGHGDVLLRRPVQRTSGRAAGGGDRAARAADQSCCWPRSCCARTARAEPDGARASRAHDADGASARALTRVRAGLTVFRSPRSAPIATVAQLAAWGLQLLSCYVLLVALGLDHQAGLAAAAAVLFAVNITAVLPATPANLGVFQAACVAVLHTGWHVGYGTGVAYGVILQAVEVTTAVLMGMPALLKEGMSWREVTAAGDARGPGQAARPARYERAPSGVARAQSRPRARADAPGAPCARRGITRAGLGQTMRVGCRTLRGGCNGVDILKAAISRTCSCEVVCPCTASLALGADYDRCRVVLAFHVDSGEVEGVDVCGLTLAAIADTPKFMHEGNWRLGRADRRRGLRRASREARRRIQRSLGGPMGALSGLVGEPLGVERVRLEFSSENGHHSLIVGDVGKAAVRTWSRSASRTGNPPG